MIGIIDASWLRARRVGFEAHVKGVERTKCVVQGDSPSTPRCLTNPTTFEA